MTVSLDAATLPLRGRHLIEASAGTGKTFTVANLYLRLLIDAEHATPPAVENILVVTFTNAATEELRARLRARIAVGLQVLDGESPTDADATLLAVLAPHRNEPATRARLELAYQSMDQAAIFTIHGFCDRVLREHAFESGELFDAELQAEVDTLRLRAAQAWWRDNVTPMSATDAESIPAKWRAPASVLNRLSSILTDPAGQLEPHFTDEQMQQTQSEYQDAWQNFSRAWETDGEEWVEQILAGVQNKQINKGKGQATYTVDTVLNAARVAADHLQPTNLPKPVDQSLSLLGNAVLSASTRKGKVALESALGACIDTLVALAARLRLQQIVALQNSAKEGIGRDLAQRKLLARQRTFDDLLLQLHAVLHGNSGERLTGVLRERYPVAMIDEFQDTDRVQYEIFDTLFPQTAESTAALYLIGDPKQSIYRFRGADISVYHRARQSADHLHSLDNNWRSSSRLINALNALYEQSDKPFGEAPLDFPEKQPSTSNLIQLCDGEEGGGGRRDGSRPEHKSTLRHSPQKGRQGSKVHHP